MADDSDQVCGQGENGVQPAAADNLSTSNKISPIEDELSNSPNNSEFNNTGLLMVVGSDETTEGCAMCANYETNLTKMQEQERVFKEHLAASKELNTRYEKEISDERLIRKEIEGRLGQLSAEVAVKVKRSEEHIAVTQNRFDQLAERHQSTMASCHEELEKCRAKYKALEGDLLKLDAKYQRLLGAHRAKAHEMQEQQIELPQSVERLQFLALQLREELIEARIAQEHEVEELSSELTVAREQLNELFEVNNQQAAETESLLLSRELARHEIEDSINGGASPQLSIHTINANALNQTNSGGGSGSRRQSPVGRYELAAVDEHPTVCRQMIADLEQVLAHSIDDRSKLEGKLAEYRRRCQSLKRDLDTSETVQKDFVHLSQELQVQLEIIRSGEHEIRWQFEEDVATCQRCQSHFSATKKPKANCKHCGKIFCPDCLSHSIPTGPNNRPAAVCDVCYTILNRDAAPFFSTQSGLNASSAASPLSGSSSPKTTTASVSGSSSIGPKQQQQRKGKSQPSKSSGEGRGDKMVD